MNHGGFILKNTQRKKELIEQGINKQYGKDQYEIFTRIGNIDETKAQLKEKYGEDYEPLEQLRKARKQQNKVIKDHIEWLFKNDYELYFYTFTYDDKKRRKEMTPETLKKYVTRALQNVDDYIINIDYGGEKERLHYHGIIAMSKDNPFKAMKLKTHLKVQKRYKEAEEVKDNLYIFASDTAQNDYINKVGFLYIEQIRDNENSHKAVTKYITKLTLHSLKVKQKYVSTKKGTDYQDEKKWIEKTTRQAISLTKQHLRHGFDGKKINK